MSPFREPTRGEPGTYALLFRASSGRIRVGRLGELAVEAGWYLYLGSAFGPGGVTARVGRHLAPSGRPRHWHVDHLHDVAALREVWYSHDRRVREHLWARAALRLPGASLAMPGFGSSDCRCPGHLVRLDRRPSLDELGAVVSRRAPAHAPLYRWPGSPRHSITGRLRFSPRAESS